MKTKRKKKLSPQVLCVVIRSLWESFQFGWWWRWCRNQTKLSWFRTNLSSAFSDTAICNGGKANGFSKTLRVCASASACALCNLIEWIIWTRGAHLFRMRIVSTFFSIVWMARGWSIAVNVFKFSDLIPFCVTEKRTHPNWDFHTFNATRKKKHTNNKQQTITSKTEKLCEILLDVLV